MVDMSLVFSGSFGFASGRKTWPWPCDIICTSFSAILKANESFLKISLKQIVAQYPVPHELKIINSAVFVDLQWKSSISEADPSDTGVGQEGCNGAVALCTTDHVPDLTIKLGETWTGPRQILLTAHQRKRARLPQRLVPEVDVQESLGLVLWAAAENVARPQPPAMQRRITIYIPI